jgi:hypothetical protein
LVFSPFPVCQARYASLHQGLNFTNELQFNKSVNALNAAFAILSAIGFASSMGACFFLNKQTKLENDLWLVAPAQHGESSLTCMQEMVL